MNFGLGLCEPEQIFSGEQSLDYVESWQKQLIYMSKPDASQNCEEETNALSSVG